MDDALKTFFSEARELLADMEAALLGADESPTAELDVNAIFRAAHTIKGSAGLFGLDGVVRFTHVLESVLDEVRAGAVAIHGPLLPLLLRCCDHVGAWVDALEAGAEPESAHRAAEETLVTQLRAFLDTPAAAPEPAAAETSQGAEGQWHLSIRFGADVLRNGMDPLAFVRYLSTIGRIERIVTLPDAVPALEALDPEGCCLGFEIALVTAADRATIESVFEFVIDDCELRLVPPRSRVAEYVDLIRALPEEPERIGEILVRCGSLTGRELEEALGRQREADPAPRLGVLLSEQGQVAPEVVEAALDRQRLVRETRSTEASTIRVDAHKLDRLITLVGELVIAAAGAQLAGRRVRDLELQEAHATLDALVQDVRDSALNLRMVRIGATFSRFKRVVHDVAAELGKDIELRVSGEDTELDKTVVEKLGDPLMHLVRNAIDHGIDSPEQRAARGKPARGVLSLNAFHDSGAIVIEVSDDGGGLNRERILAKARERGLVGAEQDLADHEIDQLIFEAGFSTAEQVTNLSGRGVGMDVVKQNITALRGSVALASRPGEGTTVTVRLPLTLAIINGFQVGVGRSMFVVPMEMVDECVAYSCADGHDYTDLRGGVLPLVRLRDLFGLGGTPPVRQNIVVVQCGAARCGLVVDALLGESQTVIRPLSRMFKDVHGISGSALLGSGDVALILDVLAIAKLALACNPARTKPTESDRQRRVETA
ncbi:chemotaxis protein CheA [Rubrivivax gelatinosus]|uniref:Chemotaxis protein CheA n=2 Tax=Rubrivivax gelatinosus TaxID=28068 RepID=A0A4R2M3R9_RUBGE|nr:chemotaxis protein CheA [Rubrivivax gelatinosus]MBK1689659.1 chemotaxis protein CheA [Rubrivivax gelatinosus]TCP01799.1 two-component system chemotaxis sensor kinase CheA [Rubrivivax gelatinosus]